MSDPWFNENLYGWVPGTALGVLCGLWGTLVGIMAPRGRARGMILGFTWVLVFTSAILLSLGLIAVVSGQPYGVWFSLGLAGLIGVLVIPLNLPNVYRVYRTAEERKLTARDLTDANAR